MVSCHDAALPELLTLHYTSSNSLVDSQMEPVASKTHHCSNMDAADHEESDPLSAETYTSSGSRTSVSDRISYAKPSESSKQDNMHDICSESGAECRTDSCALSASVAVTGVDDDVYCESHSTLYHTICTRLHSVEDAAGRHRLCDKLTILLQFFETEYLLAERSSSDTTQASFPLCLIEQYTKLVSDDVDFYSTDG